MSESIRSLVVQHDWDSYESRDLLERLHIVDALRDLPPEDLASLLKLLKPEKAEKALRLIEIRDFRSKNET